MGKTEKSMKTYTVADIAELRDCSVNMVNHWVNRSGVKPDFVKATGGTRLYNRAKINKIITFSPHYSYPAKKLLCAQMFVDGTPVSSICYLVELCRATVADIVKEVDTTGEITLESKLNFML
jgi:hypothetical protein